MPPRPSATTADRRIVLIGATGYTGRLVARELAGADAPFLLSGRDPAKLARLADSLGGAPTRTADVTREQDVRRLVRRGDVVINCAGPFTELGEPVVRASVEAGAHYVDTTGEQRFMKRIFDRYDGAARDAGAAVVNAMAFEYALGDCAAEIAARGIARPLRSVDIVYAWRVGPSGASRGTLRSMLRSIASGGFDWEGGRWRPTRAAAERRSIRLPDGRTRPAIAFPAGEAVTVPRHVDVRDVRGWIVTGRGTARVAALLSPVLPALARAATPLADRLLRRSADGPTPEQRLAGWFLITASAIGADGAVRTTTVEGRDPYGVTAVIAVRGARRLLHRAERDASAGVLAPAQVLEPEAFLDGLRDRGLDWEAASADG